MAISPGMGRFDKNLLFLSFKQEHHSRFLPQFSSKLPKLYPSITLLPDGSEIGSREELLGISLGSLSPEQKIVNMLRDKSDLEAHQELKETVLSVFRETTKIRRITPKILGSFDDDDNGGQLNREEEETEFDID